LGSVKPSHSAPAHKFPIMLGRLQSMLLRGSMQHAGRLACSSDAFQLACCRQFADAAAAPDVHRLTADATAAESSSALQQHSNSAGDVAEHESRPHPLQLPDPLETFRKSNISMPQLEGQVLVCKFGSYARVNVVLTLMPTSCSTEVPQSCVLAEVQCGDKALV
jgi:hypothetical protein